jgi:glutamate racemase
LNKDRPIGVFDSGLGGLTVLERVRQKLPNESIIYFGDTARLPYGTKSKHVVQKFSLQIARFLLEFKTKMILVACNTSSAQALPLLKRKFPEIPIIGVIEPGVKHAVRGKQRGRIGIIGTEGTIKSQVYTKFIKKYNKKINVYSQPCPLFVPLVEEGWFDSHFNLVKEIAGEYLAPLKKNRIDTLILGCTHYPLLKKIIQSAAGRNVTIVDSAESTAEETRRMLEEHKILSCSPHPQYKFFVSDEPKKFILLAHKFIAGKNRIMPTLRNTKKINIEEY